MIKELRLHYYQKELVKKLTLNHGLRFNELLISGLESEHMNYHLKKLIEFGLVVKDGSRYLLSDEGKDYSNLLDDDLKTIEKQPKTSVIIRGIRHNQKGELEHLLCKRLRHPYFGKVGRLTGKVRFGETLEQAAARELYEETGLEANRYDLDNIYRKIRHREDGGMVQDVIFYTLLTTGFSGTMIAQTSFQENIWITAAELQKRTDLDLYDDWEMLDHDQVRDLVMDEHVAIAEGY